MSFEEELRKICGTGLDLYLMGCCSVCGKDSPDPIFQLEREDLIKRIKKLIVKSLPGKKSLYGLKQFGIISEFRRGFNCTIEDMKEMMK